MPLGWLKLRSRKNKKTRSAKSKFLWRKKSLARVASRHFNSVPNLFNYVPPREVPVSTIKYITDKPTFSTEQPDSKRRTSFYEGIYSEKKYFLSNIGASIPRPLTPRRVHTAPSALISARVNANLRIASGNYNENEFMPAPVQPNRVPRPNYERDLRPSNGPLVIRKRQSQPQESKNQTPQIPMRSRERCYSTPIAMIYQGLQLDKGKRNSYVPSPLGSSSSFVTAREGSQHSLVLPRPSIRRRPVGSGSRFDNPLPPLSTPVTNPTGKRKSVVSIPDRIQNTQSPTPSFCSHSMSRKTTGLRKRQDTSTLDSNETLSMVSTKEVKSADVKEENTQNEIEKASEHRDVLVDEALLETAQAQENAKTEEGLLDQGEVQIDFPESSKEPSLPSDSDMLSEIPFNELSTVSLLQELQIDKLSVKVCMNHKVEHKITPLDLQSRETLNNSGFVTAPTSPVETDEKEDLEVPPTPLSLETQRYSVVSMTSSGSTIQSDSPSPVLDKSNEFESELTPNFTFPPKPVALGKSHSIPITITEDSEGTQLEGMVDIPTFPPTKSLNVQKKDKDSQPVVSQDRKEMTPSDSYNEYANLQNDINSAISFTESNSEPNSYDDLVKYYM